MKIISFFNDRIKAMSLWDFKLGQIAALLLMWIVIKIFPSLLQVGYTYLIIPLLLITVRLFYVVFLKR